MLDAKELPKGDVTPTEATTSVPATSAEETASHEQAEERASSSWFDRLFRPSVRQTTEPVSQGSDQEQTESKEAPASGEDKTSDETAPQTGEPFGKIGNRVFQTEDEWNRFRQSEVDRQKAAENRRLRDEARRQREERLRELRETDVQEFAEEHRKLEQEQAAESQVQQSQQYVVTLLDGVRKSFDENVMTPIVEKLSRDEQERIYSTAPSGIEGRRYIVEQSLKALLSEAEARGELNARRKLRTDKALRKEVLVDLRGSEDEPDLIPASPVFAESDDMNTRLRKAVFG